MHIAAQGMQERKRESVWGEEREGEGGKRERKEGNELEGAILHAKIKADKSR